MAEHNILGQAGEKKAIAYLRSKGYEIKAVNWTYLKIEIDIIASHSGLLIVAEVKTRSNSIFGEPETFVTRKKQRSIVKAANAYVLKHNIDMEVRFDVISVLKNGNDYNIHHIEDAFYATL